MKNYAFAGLLIVSLVQLSIPATMIFGYESIIREGKIFRFKTAPIDPSDPFRGKYITLRFQAETYEVSGDENWEYGEEIFVSLREDSAGYAEIAGISNEQPGDKNIDFVKAKVDYVQPDSITIVHVSYPFTRFYLEESKAYHAGDAVRISTRDTNNVAYALVSIKNGNAVVTDVMVNDISVKNILDENEK